MKRNVTITLLLLTAALLASCADHNSLVDTANAVGNVAGFWRGLWHGMIAPIAFIASLFSDCSIYEVHNNGGWYNFGFLLGISGAAGGSTSATKK